MRHLSCTPMLLCQVALGVEGVQMQVDPRALMKSVAMGLALVGAGCCGGMEEINLITQHDLDPEGDTFGANAVLWFTEWLVAVVTLGVIKLLIWLFRAQ